MTARLAFAVALSFGSLAACGAVTTRAADAAQPSVHAAPATQPQAHEQSRRCPASRPGRRQPALGIRCY